MGIDAIGLVAALVSALASLFTSILKESALPDELTKLIEYLFRNKNSKGSDEDGDEWAAISPHLLARLNETRKAYKRERLNESLSNVANGFLVFGQYVIGGILTTSFIQDNLKSQMISLLGLLVLATTILHQKFRPDLSSKLAADKANFLNIAVTKAENRISQITNPSSPEEKKLINMLSNALIKVQDRNEWAIKPDNESDEKGNSSHETESQ